MISFMVILQLQNDGHSKFQNNIALLLYVRRRRRRRRVQGGKTMMAHDFEKCDKKSMF
jgi:hypothetical protein